MALLHYANLDLRSPDVVLKQVAYGLRDITGYLSRSIEYLKGDAVRRASARELNRAELADLSEEERGAGVWVELDDPPDMRGDDDRALAAFFDDNVRSVYERVERQGRIDGETRFALIPKHGIDVVDADPRRQRLCLERAPQSAELLLVPNTYNLRKQREAVRALENAPHPAHRPLLDLFQGHRHVRWREVTPERLAEEDWILLASKPAGAPLRPGTEEQRRFVEVALATPDFALLEGPPGSGKTTTICEFILQELRLGHRVLLCASTHVAVDNVIERLMAEDQPARDEVIPVRIGDPKNIADKVKPYQLESLQRTEKDRLRKWLRAHKTRSRSQATLLEALDRPEDVVSRLILESANVVCGTTIGILQHPDIIGGMGSSRMSDSTNCDCLPSDHRNRRWKSGLMISSFDLYMSKSSLKETSTARVRTREIAPSTE
jgi:AAA domain